MNNTAKYMFETKFDVADDELGIGEAKLLTGREIKALRDSAFDAGVNEGTARENRTTEHRQSEALAALANRMRAIADQQSQAMDHIIDEATSLTMVIARKISPALARHEPLVGIETMIREFLQQLIDEPHIVVRVPEVLIDDLKLLIDDIAAGSGYSGRVVLMPDPVMNGNDCRLEWADGGAVRNVDIILQDIETGLARALQKPLDLSTDLPADGVDQSSAVPQ